MALFTVQITYTQDTDRINEVRPSHRAYLTTLLEAGKLQQSGPFVDGTGALLIYDVADLAELQEVVAADPYTRNGIIAASETHEWNVVFSRFA